jgi:hypothetical protein
MSPRKKAKTPKRRVVQRKTSKANPMTSKHAWAVNSGLVFSSVLLNVAQCAPLLGVQHAAQAAMTVFSTIEVSGRHLPISVLKVE